MIDIAGNNLTLKTDRVSCAAVKPARAHKRTHGRAPSTVLPAATIDTDGRTVWVNSASGICIGRFSARGVDVHADYEEQMRDRRQCLECCHDLPFDESWTRFQQSMAEHYGLTISDDFKPAHRVAS